jgi:hypothetical protein
MAGDRDLLVAVMRLLQDRGVLAGDGVRDRFEELAAGRVVALSDELLEELSVPSTGNRRSKSS